MVASTRMYPGGTDSIPDICKHKFNILLILRQILIGSLNKVLTINYLYALEKIGTFDVRVLGVNYCTSCILIVLKRLMDLQFYS